MPKTSLAEPGSLMPQIVTATVQMSSEEVEFVGLLPTEEVETAMAQAVTLTDTDVGLATCKVVTATLVDEHDQKIQGGAAAPEVTFWHTSLGKFRFTLEELPTQLQLIYALMLVSTKWNGSISGTFNEAITVFFHSSFVAGRGSISGSGRSIFPSAFHEVYLFACRGLEQCPQAESGLLNLGSRESSHIEILASVESGIFPTGGNGGPFDPPLSDPSQRRRHFLESCQRRLHL